MVRRAPVSQTARLANVASQTGASAKSVSPLPRCLSFGRASDHLWCYLFVKIVPGLGGVILVAAPVGHLLRLCFMREHQSVRHSNTCAELYHTCSLCGTCTSRTAQARATLMRRLITCNKPRSRRIWRKQALCLSHCWLDGLLRALMSRSFSRVPPGR